MTVQEVSELLKVDFSPTQGIFFPCFSADIYLSIHFKDNRVSKINTGQNGTCIGHRP